MTALCFIRLCFRLEMNVFTHTKEWPDTRWRWRESISNHSTDQEAKRQKKKELYMLSYWLWWLPSLSFSHLCGWQGRCYHPSKHAYSQNTVSVDGDRGIFYGRDKFQISASIKRDVQPFTVKGRLQNLSLWKGHISSGHHGETTGDYLPNTPSGVNPSVMTKQKERNKKDWEKRIRKTLWSNEFQWPVPPHPPFHSQSVHLALQIRGWTRRGDMTGK